MKRLSFRAILLAVALISVTSGATADPVPPGLRPLAVKHHLLFGTAVDVPLLNKQTDGGLYVTSLVANFNMVEMGNELKPASVWRDKNVYDFTNPDILLGTPGKTGWAQQHGLTVRGHTLIYGRDQGYTLPPWLVTEPGRVVNKAVEDSLTKAEAADLLHTYIHTVVSRYKGKIAMWDVINETIDDAKNSNPYNLRDSFWFRKLGPGFVDMAFRWAHEADPKAKLYYNDYGIEGPGPKADAVFALVKSLKAKGVPIDGVGMQWHTGVWAHVAPGDGYYQTAQRLKDNGIDFMVTELDVAVPVVVYPQNDPRYGLVPINPADLDKQAAIFAGVIAYARSFSNCRGVNVWGFTDAHSWIPAFTIGRLKSTPPGAPQGAATLLDVHYQPKPAYYALEQALSK